VISPKESIKRMVDFTFEKYDKLDMACNDAGIELFNPTVDTTREKYDKVMNINVWGVLTCMKYQLPAMLKNGTSGGSIVNMASIAGLIGFPGLSVYVASKHAVQGLTKSVALEYAKQNIRVNSVAPGLIDTPMADRILEVIPKSAFESMTPMGRVGKPEEIAIAVEFLLDPANTYMTGQCVTVDGGWVAQ
jgi:NAD(P)-dependent dehydrogenase (short-subunit alcohol dehydrogenase family)